MAQYVFIIGGSRTGSELLKGILEKYSDITFVNEMHLLAPKWLRKDFKTVVVEEFGGFGPELCADNIFKAINDKKLDGYYWKEFEDKVDRTVFREAFDSSNRQLSDVLEAAMIEKANKEGKKIKGAKFPVHYANSDKLIEWYPDCLLIHTVRDPRGVYYSQSRKYINEADSWHVVFKKKLLQFVHIVIQSFRTAIMHLKYRGRRNYFFARYEDLLGEPELFFHELCDFLGIDYSEDLANPRVYSNSSFSEHRGKRKELDKSAIDRWRSSLSIVERIMMTLCSFPSLLIFGYRV